MSATEVVVIAVAIILAIVTVTATVLVARRLDRDEPGSTYYDPDLYRGQGWHG